MGIGAIAPALWLGSVGMNLAIVGIGVWAIARRGGWSFWRDRILSGQPLSDERVQSMSSYIHRRSQLDLLPIQPSDIVFLGDSITEGGEWSNWFPTVSICNRGISADTTTGVLRRLDTIVDSTPRKLFLMIGINDLVNQGKTPERVLMHYEQILKVIKARSPQTQVYVQSVLPIVDFPRVKALNQTIVTLNQGLHQLATQFACTYIDLHPMFLEGDKSLSRNYTSDGVHLNGAGYAQWVERIRAEVQSPIAKEPKQLG